MWNFLKKLGRAIYDCTIGAVIRLVRHTKAGTVDNEDKQVVGRFVIYTAFLVFAVFFPTAAALIGLFRTLTVIDIIGLFGSVFQQTANALAVE